jgi:hypothetical protein
MLRKAIDLPLKPLKCDTLKVKMVDVTDSLCSEPSSGSKSCRPDWAYDDNAIAIRHVDDFFMGLRD